jgi:hypothetical protein
MAFLFVKMGSAQDRGDDGMGRSMQHLFSKGHLQVWIKKDKK